MPYSDLTGDVWRVGVFVYYSDEQLQITGMNMQIISAGPSDSRVPLAQYIYNSYLENCFPLLPTEASFLGVKVSPLVTPVPYAPISIGPERLGTAGPGVLPTQIRPLISWGTELAGRRYRGRSYGHTPHSIEITPDGAPSAGVITAWNAFANDMFSSVLVGGSVWKPCIVHRPSKKHPEQPVPPPTRVNAYEIGPHYATQRRSGGYGAKNLKPLLG